MSIQWKGIMPAVTTKFTDNDELDLKTFELNINAQLEAGVHGIVLGGTLGEASTLLDEEKRLFIVDTSTKNRLDLFLNLFNFSISYFNFSHNTILSIFS